ncbi:MAG: SDR family NAD(P)-dependent oxidoreductase [Tepidiformaceae bacterium]
MKDMQGRVAVVTGGASGMGLAFARRFSEEGMNVVVADIESEPLAMAEAAIKEKGGKVLAVRTNVLEEEDIERLADAAFATFGNVHVLCNNAGVSGGRALPVWEMPLIDWQWVFGVNFMGVLRGIRSFVPRMLENGDEGHIVNTASMAGLLTSADPYAVSKHGVVCLTEGLYRDFKLRKTRLSASVLCPGWVNTNILESGRNRPSEYGEAVILSKQPPEIQQAVAGVSQLLKNGFQPEEVAQRVLQAILDDTFYIIPAQDYMLTAVRQRFDNILTQTNPAIPVV